MTPAEVAGWQELLRRADPMNAHAELSDARAELVATAVMWHGSEAWAPELHRAVERYQVLRELWVDSLTPLPVEPP